MASLVGFFAMTALISGMLGIVGVLIFNPTQGLDSQMIKTILSQAGSELSPEAGTLSLSGQLVKTITVGDFSDLFSKNNMLQIIIFAALFGLSTVLLGEQGSLIRTFLNDATKVMMKMVTLIMYYAPIGLGCYFAFIVGQLGTQILQGYVRVFLLYLALTAVNYFIFFSLYAYLSAGKGGFRRFWANAMSPTMTALATCSSAASIPANLEAAQKIGITKDIAETVIPLGSIPIKMGP